MLQVFGVQAISDIQQRQQPVEPVVSLAVPTCRLQDLLQPVDQQ
jgi:hypothetical protein